MMGRKVLLCHARVHRFTVRDVKEWAIRRKKKGMICVIDLINIACISHGIFLSSSLRPFRYNYKSPIAVM